MDGPWGMPWGTFLSLVFLWMSPVVAIIVNQTRWWRELTKD